MKSTIKKGCIQYHNYKTVTEDNNQKRLSYGFWNFSQFFFCNFFRGVFILILFYILILKNIRHLTKNVMTLSGNSYYFITLGRAAIACFPDLKVLISCWHLKIIPTLFLNFLLNLELCLDNERGRERERERC